MDDEDIPYLWILEASQMSPGPPLLRGTLLPRATKRAGTGARCDIGVLDAWKCTGSMRGGL